MCVCARLCASEPVCRISDTDFYVQRQTEAPFTVVTLWTCIYKLFRSYKICATRFTSSWLPVSKPTLKIIFINKLQIRRHVYFGRFGVRIFQSLQKLNTRVTGNNVWHLTQGGHAHETSKCSRIQVRTKCEIFTFRARATRRRFQKERFRRCARSFRDCSSTSLHLIRNHLWNQSGKAAHFKARC